MPPRGIERVVFAPSIYVGTVHIPRAIFVLECRTLLDLWVKLVVITDVAEPAASFVSIGIDAKGRRNARMCIHDLKGLEKSYQLD